MWLQYYKWNMMAGTHWNIHDPLLKCSLPDETTDWFIHQDFCMAVTLVSCIQIGPKPSLWKPSQCVYY